MATTCLTLRTQDDIIDRIRDLNRRPIGLGFHQEVLVLHGLDFDHASPFLKPEVLRGDWPTPTEATVKTAAMDYLEFAVAKAVDHRGLSAARSIEKMECFCWLLGAPIGTVTGVDYPMYGVPGLRVAADFLGWSWPSGNTALDNMAAGRSCVPDCPEGCGL